MILFPPKIHYILLLLSLLSCGRSKPHLISMDESVRLDGETLTGTLTDCCNELLAWEGRILVCDWCNDTALFRLISTSPGSPVISFGRKGKGPGEYLTPFLFKDDSGNDSSVVFSVYDINLLKFDRYRLKKSSGVYGNTFQAAYGQLPADVFPCLDLYKSGSTFYGNHTSFVNGLFFIYDQETGQKKWVDFVPASFQRNFRDNQLMYFVYSNRIAVNPKAGRIVVAMKYFSQVHVFDMTGRHIRSITTEVTQQPEIRGLDIAETSKLYTLDLYATDDRVYVLWSGDPAKKQEETGPGASRVLVLDWDGRPVQLLEIDRAMQIGISPDNRRLFSAGFRGQESFLMQYFIYPGI